MRLGEIKTFPNMQATRKQAIKIMEEAAEVFSQFDDSWTASETDYETWKNKVCYECADVIMATCNLVSGFGIKDMRPYIRNCEKIQMSRGRYDEV